VYRNGRWENRTVTEWRWEKGRASVDFDDILVSGSGQLSKLLLEKMGDYNLHALVPDEASFLAGIQAQAYDVDLDTAWEQGRRTMRSKTKDSCKAQATSSKMCNFSMSLAFKDENWRYILLPLYMATYRYGTETYQVLLNGQTGELAGQRPVDWKKVLLVTGGLMAPAVFLGLLTLILANVAGGAANYASVVGITAVVAFVIGLIVAGVIVVTATTMDDR
jgi:hypothetical protein